MKLTSDYIIDAEYEISQLFRGIPGANATWAVRGKSDGYSTIELELLLIYGSTFRYDSLKEGDLEDRSYEDFLGEWKQYVDEATHTTPIQYSGDALTIDDAIDNLVCDIDEDKEIDVALIHRLIELRDKINTEKQV